MSWIIQALIAWYKWIAAAFPLSGIISYYKLQANWSDSLGTGDMTEANTSYSAWKIWNAVSLNWSTSTMRNGWITLPTWASPYSINFWVKLNVEIASWVYTLSFLWPDETNQDTQYSIDYEYNGGTRRLNLQHYYNWPETYWTLPSNVTLWTANWNMVTATYSGSVMKLYLNGSQVATWWWTWTYGSNWPQTYQKWLTMWSNYVLSAYWARSNAMIDEYGIWNKVLSPSEITDLYNAWSWNQIPVSSSVLVYAYGGYNGSYQSINDAYDNLANSWTSKTAMTVAKRWIWCFALWSFSYAVWWSTWSKVATNYEYSQSWNSWATKTAMTSAKDNGTSWALWSDKWYCIAWTDWSSNLTTNYEYSQSGNSWATKTASTQASRWLWNWSNILTDKIYQSCGYIAAPSAIHLEYSQSWNSWVTKTSRSEARYDGSFSTVLLSNFAYYNWGWTGAALSTVNARYSQSWNSWSSRTACPVQRYWVWSTPVDNDRVSVIAWWDGWSTYYNTMYTFSESANAWSTRTALGTSRADFQGATI